MGKLEVSKKVVSSAIGNTAEQLVVSVYKAAIRLCAENIHALHCKVNN